MRKLFYILLVFTLCSCHCRKQIQTEHHAIEHTVDSVSTQSTSSSYTSVDSVSTTIGGKDIVIDVVEVTENYDSLGRVTSKKTKKTNIHHKDSVATVTNQHTIFTDTSAVAQLQVTNKDTDTQDKLNKKTSWGSVVLEVVLGIVIVVVLFFGIKIARHLICNL